MGLWDSTKKAAAKTKIKGEILLIDNKITAEKKKLGLPLFSIIFEWEHDNELKDMPVEGLAAIYLAAKDNILEYAPTLEEKREELDTLQDDRETHAMYAASNNQRTKNAGNWVSTICYINPCSDPKM